MCELNDKSKTTQTLEENMDTFFNFSVRVKLYNNYLKSRGNKTGTGYRKLKTAKTKRTSAWLKSLINTVRIQPMTWETVMQLEG